jgi:large subunit ribosomal protein L4
MKFAVKNIQGAAQGELEVNIPVVEAGHGDQAVHQTVVAYMAAQRSGTACTKTMGEVAGTGKKPWRQKGTGRARAGSFASPIWRGGGVVFGPKPRDFRQKLPKSMRHLALKKAFAARCDSGDVVLVEEFKLAAPKTREFSKVLTALDLDAGTLLVVISAQDSNLELAVRNMVGVELTTSAELNTYQVLRSDKMLITKGAIALIEQRLAK